MPRAGSVRLYRRGRVWWCWGYDTDGGRWRASTHQQDRKAAEAAARRIERQRAAGSPDTPKATLREALRMLLAYDERAGRAAATVEIHAHKGRHLMRLLGRGRRLAELTKADLEGYTDTRLAEGVARLTIHKELATLRQAMRVSGAGWDRALMPELGKVYTPRERWLSKEECARLQLALPPRRQPYLILWCHLGLRRSELYSLRAEDVDLERRQVRVRGTKTAGADRVISLNSEAEGALRRALGRDPLFPEWGNVNRDLRAACRRAGIEPVSPNDLRRTFCSWMANAGVPSLTCSRLLGHTSTRMVEQVYARLGADVQRAAVEAISSVTRGVTNAVAHPSDSLDSWDSWDDAEAGKT